jgi:Arc/MetJ-type ribon-helix-helix transcriptional regulator
MNTRDRKRSEVKLAMKQKEEKKAVSLPAELYDRIEERISSTEFDSVDEYVIFVLAEILKEEGEEERAFSQQDEAEVKGRLKALGYLD